MGWCDVKLCLGYFVCCCVVVMFDMLLESDGLLLSVELLFVGLYECVLCVIDCVNVVIDVLNFGGVFVYVVLYLIECL